MPSIKVNDINFSYNVEPILKEISLSFGKGNLYGILGPNGCGKTTFLNIVGRLLKQNYGDILVNEINLDKMSIKEIAKTLAYVQQKSEALDFNFTVEEIVLMGRYSYIDRFSRESEDDHKIVNDILKDLNLEELKSREFNKLSGGEQQKVMIARAIAQQTKIILLDEPTSHLDINYKLELMELFQKFVQKGILILIVLHDLNLAAQFCDKIILLNNGKVHAFGDVSETITEQNVKEVYNVDVIIESNPITQSTYVLPISNFLNSKLKMKQVPDKKKIHIIAGGGTATKFLPLISNINTTIGVLHVLDDDHTMAERMNIKTISEAPFSPVSDKTLKLLEIAINQSSLVILTNVPFGNANLVNLKVLENFKGKIIIIEETPIEKRDFTEGKATEIYNRIVEKPDVFKTSTIEEMLVIKDKIIHNLED